MTELMIKGPGDAVRDTLVSALGPDPDALEHQGSRRRGVEVNLTNVGKDLTPENASRSWRRW